MGSETDLCLICEAEREPRDGEGCVIDEVPVVPQNEIFLFRLVCPFSAASLDLFRSGKCCCRNFLSNQSLLVAICQTAGLFGPIHMVWVQRCTQGDPQAFEQLLDSDRVSLQSETGTENPTIGSSMPFDGSLDEATDGRGSPTQ
ncbi:hypothetical protein GUJ93_ZPchr0013g37010 [Zizania palustris]|uniref:Uncharacterized protein n=1 Tax=Zizania palustris TaxID=103762 RepID=A0A8J6BZC9_ZIZPA|nr:hypothetical protein GUJ93_ZPchr0013g37010 [Zizania palustris]